MGKYYVVWTGHHTGIYDTWEECKAQVDGFPGARYKSFATRIEAIEAYRGDPEEELAILRAIASHEPKVVDYSAIPDIVADSIAVDAACSRNPGPVEYQGVDVTTGARLFHVGPLAGGTNNIGEFLALVHALALFDRQGNHHTAVYSDSRTALSWLRNRKAKTTLTPTDANAPIRALLARAEAWIQTHNPRNRVLKWDTERWGEIPADFGRK